MKKIFKMVQITLPKEINTSNDVLSTQGKSRPSISAPLLGGQRLRSHSAGRA